MSGSVEISNVTKRFGTVTALDNISFLVRSGEFISLLGPSGCGKTTMLRLIAGFEQPDAGRVLIAGQDVAGKRPYERSVGVFFQHYALFPHMTVEQNVAYGLRHRGYPKTQIRKRVGEMLELVKLTAEASRRPGQLSGGQQQRVALARALATEPEVVLLDEPLSALDAKLRQELRIEVRNILRVVGSTAIIVTHDQEEAMGLTERIIIMHEGRILQEGTPDNIYSRPSSRYVAEFVGHSNWFEGRFTDKKVTHQAFSQIVTQSGLEITIRNLKSIQSDEVLVCVRPERIELIESEDQVVVGENVMRGQILDSTILGPDLNLRVRLLSGDIVNIVAQNRVGKRFTVGEAVTMAFHADQCIVLPNKN
jgi:spermidine/putrescine ABC transporter ATP-binding subunit